MKTKSTKRRAFDLEAFCKTHGVEYYSEGHKQCRPGWIQLKCPFCSAYSDKPFLGYNLTGHYFHCWQCGTHPLIETLLLLSKIPYSRLRIELERFSSFLLPTQARRDMESKTFMTQPSWWGQLLPIHQTYLQLRGFSDIEALRQTWKLFGSGHIAPSGFAYRVIIPIYDEQDRLLTYTSRAVCNSVQAKYKACPESQTVYSTKECIYGLNNVPGDSIIIVEGPVDVWKIGPGAVCPCGIAFTDRQIRLLSSFKKRYILFDSEPEAQRRASKLGEELDCFEGETWVIEAPDSKDPGEMPEREARQLGHKLLYGEEDYE